MRRLWTGAFVLCVAGGIALAQGQRGDDQKQSKAGAEKFSDQQFVQKASASDLAEINLGRLAEQRAANAAVKQFGQKLVQDHTKSSTELLRLADKHGLRPAQQMDQHHQQTMDKLTRLSGTEFDRAFVKHMLHDHQEGVQLFKTAAKECQQADLKSFAGKTLPVLEEHLRTVKQLSGEGQGSAVSKDK